MEYIWSKGRVVPKFLRARRQHAERFHQADKGEAFVAGEMDSGVLRVFGGCVQ